VDYHHLLDIGREIVQEAVPRPLHIRALRSLLKHGLISPWFARFYRLGVLLRPFMPKVLQDKVQVPNPSGITPARAHQRKVLLLEGCVQNTMMPNVGSATSRVLDAMGIQALYAPQAGCCGALAWHLSDGEMAKAQMRNNIDAWWPFISGDHPIEAIVMNASGCGVMVNDYGHVLRDDPLYHDKAKRVSELCQDLSVFLSQQLDSMPSLIDTHQAKQLGSVVFHPPCTLQHGQQIKGVVEHLLLRLGFDLTPPAKDAHLCCGSAGTYSVLEQALSSSLKARKISHLENTGASLILSANVGCISHLQSATPKPVLHWIEALDRVIKVH
jgi:glycolate oxidase iron-sulfur subunit